MNDLKIYLQREQNLALAKKLTFLVWIITVVVLLLVGLMRQVKLGLPEGVTLHFLPPFPRTIQTICQAIP